MLNIQTDAKITERGRQSRQLRYRSSKIELLDEGSTYVSSFGIQLFTWAFAVVLFATLLLCVLSSKLQPNGSENPNESNADENITDAQNGDANSRKQIKEDEEERRKNTIHRLFFQSEQNTQKIICDQIRHKSHVISVASEEPVTVDGLPNSADASNASSNEEVGGNTRISINTEYILSNPCVLCLEEYQEGDTIVRSSNEDCRHVFHRDCLMGYFLVLKENDSAYPCPCCRQNYFTPNQILSAKRECKNAAEIPAIHSLQETESSLSVDSENET